MTQLAIIRRSALALCVGLCALIASADPAVPPAGAKIVNGATGNDRTGLGTIASPYKTVDKGLDAAFTDIQTTTTNAVTDNLRHLLDAAILYADSTTTAALATTPGRAALIVGNGNIYNRTADLMIKNELVRMGYEVQVVDDFEVTQNPSVAWQTRLFTTAIANTKDVIVVSGSVGAGNVDNLRDTTTPVVLMNPSSWRRWGFFDSATDGGLGQIATAVDITNPGHALAAGLTGLGINVYSHSHGLSVVPTGTVLPKAGVVQVATRAGLAAELCLWTMAAGQARGTDAGNNATNPTAVNPAIAVGFLLFGVTPTGGTSNEDFISAFSAPYMSGTGASDTVRIPADRVSAPVKTVCVAAGTYPLSHPLGLFRNLNLQGGWNATFDDQVATRTTTIDGQLKNRLIYAANQNQNYTVGSSTAGITYGGNPLYSNCDGATVDSLTLTNGRMYVGRLYGGAVFSAGAVTGLTFQKCTFFNNASDGRGGAIYIDTNFAYLQCTDCTFTSNTTYDVGNGGGNLSNGGVLGTNNGPNPNFLRCLFNNNISTRAGSGGILATRSGNTRGGSMINCLFIDNLTTGGANPSNRRMIEWDGAENDLRRQYVLNNTFYNNRATGELVRTADSVGRITIANNLFLNNSAVGTSTSTLVNNGGALGTQRIVANNLVWNNSRYDIDNDGHLNVGQNGNISADPLLVNAAGGDFHLTATSPAINAGQPFYAQVPADLDGLVRPQPVGGKWDIGAFEFPLTTPNMVDGWTLY